MFSFVNESHDVPPAHKRCNSTSSCGFKTWIVDIHLHANQNPDFFRNIILVKICAFFSETFYSIFISKGWVGLWLGSEGCGLDGVGWARE